MVLSEDNSTALVHGETPFGEFNGDPDNAGAGVRVPPTPDLLLN
jgi:hypothetical protein